VRDDFDRAWDLSWREYEKFVEESVSRACNPDIWRIEKQWRRTYSDGINCRFDVHIAERRQGGIGIVIDAKHFKIADLNKNEIDTTIQYRKRSRSSSAIIILSPTTFCPDSVWRYADSFDGLHVMYGGRHLVRSLDALFREIENDLCY